MKLTRDCLLNGKMFKVIERVNIKGERVWIKAEPADKHEPTIVANVLDRPSEVTWKIKGSHLEEVGPFGKRNYTPVTSSGSIYLSSPGEHRFSKPSSSTVSIFPISPIASCDVLGNFDSGSTFAIETNDPAWFAFAATSGTITQLFDECKTKREYI